MAAMRSTSVTAIAEVAIDNERDGIDIYFLNLDVIFKVKDEARGITVRFPFQKDCLFTEVK
jgi:hypothetical protein